MSAQIDGVDIAESFLDWGVKGNEAWAHGDFLLEAEDCTEAENLSKLWGGKVVARRVWISEWEQWEKPVTGV